MPDIIDKEIELIEMKYENAISNIEDYYLIEGVGSKIGTAVSKIIDKIKKFFIKLKMKLQEKMETAKLKRTMKLLKAAANNGKANRKTIQYDQTRDLVKLRTEKFFKDCNKILKMRDPAKIEPAFIKCYNEANKDIDMYINASNMNSTGKKWLKTLTISRASRMVISDIEKMNKEMDNMCKRMITLCEQAESIDDVLRESTDDDYVFEMTTKTSVKLSNAIAGGVSKIGMKATTFYTNHSKAINAITAVLLAYNIFSAGQIYGREEGEKCGYMLGRADGVLKAPKKYVDTKDVYKKRKITDEYKKWENDLENRSKNNKKERN